MKLWELTDMQIADIDKRYYIDWEEDPLLTVMTQEHRFYAAMSALAQRLHI